MGLILKKINGQESKFLKFHYLHFDLLNWNLFDAVIFSYRDISRGKEAPNLYNGYFNFKLFSSIVQEKDMRKIEKSKRNHTIRQKNQEVC